MVSRLAPERVLTYRAIVFLIAIFAAFAAYVLIKGNPRSPTELKAEDALIRAAGPQPTRADMVIVALDDASVQQYGAIESWPRSVLAAGLRQIETGKPKMVVFDLGLNRRTHSGDADLWREIANNRNVVLGMAYNADRSPSYTPDDIRSLVFLEQFAIADNLVLSPKTQVFPYDLFEPPVSDFTGSSRGVGVFTRETDPDGVLRTARLFYKSTVQYPQSTAPLRGKFPVTRLADGAPVALPNLSLVSALNILQLDKSNVHVSSGNEVFLSGNINPSVKAPVDDQGRMSIRFAGSAGRFQSYSFRDVAQGKVKAESFRDKIILIGATAVKDPATELRATPFPGMMPRVEVTANALATLLNRSYFGRYEYRYFGILLLIGLITGGCLMFTGGLRAAVTGLLLLIAFLAASYVLYAFSHVMLPILPGLLVILITWVVTLALSTGPFRPVPIEPVETYVPPPPGVVR